MALKLPLPKGIPRMGDVHPDRRPELVLFHTMAALGVIYAAWGVMQLLVLNHDWTRWLGVLWLIAAYLCFGSARLNLRGVKRERPPYWHELMSRVNSVGIIDIRVLPLQEEVYDLVPLGVMVKGDHLVVMVTGEYPT